ncbi:MAG TPA: hypothetical protein VF593_13260 [Chthoniobacteraceae bacterium]
MNSLLFRTINQTQDGMGTLTVNSGAVALITPGLPRRWGAALPPLRSAMGKA